MFRLVYAINSVFRQRNALLSGIKINWVRCFVRKRPEKWILGSLWWVTFTRSLGNEYKHVWKPNIAQTRTSCVGQTASFMKVTLYFTSCILFCLGELEADKSVRNITLKDIIQPTSDCYTDPLILIDTSSGNRTYHESRMQTSYTNVGEAKLVAKQVRALIAGGLNSKQVGVITPYRSQVDCIRKLLCNSIFTVIMLSLFSGHARHNSEHCWQFPGTWVRSYLHVASEKSI